MYARSYHSLTILISLAVLLSGCSAQPGQVTSPAATANPTQIPLTDTPSPAPLETDTALPPTSSPTPAVQTIGVDNAQNLSIRYRLGKGTIWAPPVFAPDGGSFVVCSTTGAHFYDTDTLQEIGAFPTQGWAALAAFSPQGDLLVTGSRLHVTIYDLPSGEIVHDLQAPDQASYLMDLATSPDGKMLAAGYGDGKYRVWSVESGRLLYSGQGSQLAFSPTGSLIAGVDIRWGEPSKVFLYEAATGRLLKEWDGERASFTPDGLLVLESGGAVRVIDPVTWKTPQAYNGSQAAFSADGKRVALAVQNNVEILDASSGARLQRLEGSYGIIQDLQFSPDGGTLAGAVNLFDCCVSGADTTVLWNLEDGSILTSTLQYYLYFGSFSPDGSAYMTGGRFGVDLLDPSSGALLNSLEDYNSAASAVAFSPSGESFAAAFGEPMFNVQIWDAVTGQLEQRLLDEGMNGGGYSYLDLEFSPDGRFMALRGDIWEVESGKQMQELQRIMSEDHSFWASSITFQPEVNILATGSFDGYLALWNLDNLAVEGKVSGAIGEVISLDYSNDGSLLAAVTGYPEYKVYIWAMPAGEPVMTLEGENENYVGVAFAPDGEMFATLTRFDEVTQGGYVRFWRVSDGGMLLQTESENVTSMAFSGDGQVMALGCLDGSLRVIAVGDGSLVATLAGHSGLISGVAFSADGRQLASSSADGTVYLWSLEP